MKGNLRNQLAKLYSYCASWCQVYNHAPPAYNRATHVKFKVFEIVFSHTRARRIKGYFLISYVIKTHALLFPGGEQSKDGIESRPIEICTACSHGNEDPHCHESNKNLSLSLMPK